LDLGSGFSSPTYQFALVIMIERASEHKRSGGTRFWMMRHDLSRDARQPNNNNIKPNQTKPNQTNELGSRVVFVSDTIFFLLAFYTHCVYDYEEKK
jgi:hypothetical protein